MEARTAATLIAVGTTSFEDWDMFTWSFGCTLEPRISDALLETTSFTFMLSPVPDPVWKTSTTISPSLEPSMTSDAAASMAEAMPASMTPSARFARAAAIFTAPIAHIMSLGNLVPVSRKRSLDLSV